MRGEGLLYGLAFLGILGAGVALVGPRLRAPERGERTPQRPQPQERREPTGARLDAPAPAARRVVTLSVTGAGGALRGPLRPVQGARARALGDDAQGRTRLELTLEADAIAFGASGHQWVVRAAATLEEQAEIVLPVAAPSVMLRVREADGAPAPGVPVEVRPRSPAGARRSDAGGTVVLDDLAPGLAVLLVGGREREAAPLRVLAGEDRDARVVLEPALVVTGRVVGPGGAALANASVAGHDAQGSTGAPVRTAADGTFRWLGPVHDVFALLVAGDGLGTEAFEVRPTLGSLRVELGDLRLAAAQVEISGRVRGGGGRATARVTVEPAAAALLRELLGPESVLTPPAVTTLDAEGGFVLRGLPADVPLRVSLRGAGLPEDALLAPRAGDRVLRQFEPLAGETLRLLLRDGPGGPALAGQEVLVSADPVDGDARRAADQALVTDAAGRAALEGLARGPWYVRAYRDGRRSLLARVDLPSLGETSLAFVPAITDAARRLEGVVVDDGGRPLPGVSVRAAGVQGRTGPDGRFTLEGVESLSAKVELSCAYEPGAEATPDGDPRDFTQAVSEVVVPGGPRLTLVLPRDQALAWRALDALDDRPLAWVRAVARSDDGRVWLDRVLASPDGRYLVSGLPRVGLTLTLLAPGRRLTRLLPLERVGTAAADTRIPRDLGDLALVRGLSVTGQVTDGRGAPLAGARVAALGEGWLKALAGDVAARRELALRATAVDGAGRYTLDGLDPLRPAGLVLWAPGMAPTLRRAVFAAGAGEEAGALERLHARVDAELRVGSHVSLLLSDLRSTEPVHGAVVDLSSARNGSDYLDLVLRGVLGGQAASTAEWRAVSEHLLWEGREEGVYTLGPVEPGEYELLVEHPLYLPERRKIPVLDHGAAVSYETLEPEEGARFDPNDPAALARLKRGPEMVTVYGSDKMRIPLSLRRR